MSKPLTPKEQSEAQSILNHLCSMPRYGNATTTNRVAKSILLNGPVFACGEMYDVKAKSMGLGVYELRLKLRYP